VFEPLQDLWRRWRYGRSIVVVSGLPRSGTSMMMKMLAAGGLELVTDHVRSADEDNPRGYFELEKVKQLDKNEDKSWLADCRGKGIKIVSSLLPELPGDYHYRVLFMRRHLQEVVASQNKMLVRRGENPEPDKNERMVRSYTMHLRKIEFLLDEEPNFTALDVDYTGVLEDPKGCAARIGSFLKMKLDADRMSAAVDRSLYRNRVEAR
jgi:hypothetical protein